MARIDDIFADLRTSGRKALMPFVTAGYPSGDITRALLPELERAGASIVEVGIPFSDPIADGPVIASSMHEALTRGVTPGDVFEIVADLRDDLSMGLVAMLSYSIISRMKPEMFITRVKDAGFDGLIVPDIDTFGDASPAARLASMCRERDMSFSLLIAPTTTAARMAHLVKLCTGFVYLQARLGITGATGETPKTPGNPVIPEIAARIDAVRELTDLPIAAGFGISNPEHVRSVTAHADAAIVGSALVERMGAADDPIKVASAFVRELASGLATTSSTA